LPYVRNRGFRMVDYADECYETARRVPLRAAAAAGAACSLIFFAAAREWCQLGTARFVPPL
jgi:hypothetical protein